MSAEEAGVGRQALKTVKELLEKAEDSAHEALRWAAPAVRKSVDMSMDAASKGFAATMKSIDGATTKEQVRLLRAYRKVLSAQISVIDARLGTLEAQSLEPRKQAAPSAG